MPTVPRLLIDVPGGEEEGVFVIVPDIHVLLNYMDETISEHVTAPYVELLEGMGSIQLPPRVLLIREGFTLNEPAEREAFQDDAVDTYFPFRSRREANMWVGDRLRLPPESHPGVVGPGSFGLIGFLVNTKDLSDYIVAWHHEPGLPAPIKSGAGVVAIRNDSTQMAIYKVFRFEAYIEVLPFATRGLDIGNAPRVRTSVGAYRNTNEWFWNVRPLTPFEYAVKNKAYRAAKGEYVDEDEPEMDFGEWTGPPPRFHPSEEQQRNAAYTAIEYSLAGMSREDLRTAYRETAVIGGMDMPSYANLLRDQMILNIMEAVGHFTMDQLDVMLQLLGDIRGAELSEEEEPYIGPTMHERIEGIVSLMIELPPLKIRNVYNAIIESIRRDGIVNVPNVVGPILLEELPIDMPSGRMIENVRHALDYTHVDAMPEIFDLGWRLRPARTQTNREWVQDIVRTIRDLNSAHLVDVYNKMIRYIETIPHVLGGDLPGDLPVRLPPYMPDDLIIRHIKRGLRLLDSSDMSEIMDYVVELREEEGLGALFG